MPILLCTVSNDSAYYFRYGYNTWRDNMRPTQILNRLCQKSKLGVPSFDQKGHVTIDGVTFTGEANVENQHGMTMFFVLLMYPSS